MDGVHMADWPVKCHGRRRVFCSKREKIFGALSLVVLLLLTFGRAAVSRGTTRPVVADSGTVIYVYDGDTVKVRLDSGEEKRVRLIGVDSPEYNDPKEELRLMAFLAKRFTAFHLQRKSVRLAYDRERTDVYGRTLAYVWLDERTLFNEVLVGEGFASAYLKYPFDPARMERFKTLEAEARRAQKGLWRSGPFPQVEPGAVEGSLGRVVAVRFRCLRAFDRSGFRVIVPSEGRFEVVIPKETLISLPGSLDFESRTLLVTGFVEDYKGRPQIVVGIPAQLKTVG